MERKCSNMALGIFLSTLSLRRATFHDRVALIPHQHFYPRSPCGERLPTGGQTFEINLISIHALLAESDPSIAGRITSNGTNFYPRSPCGERLSIRSPALSGHHFYPRSPCGERHNINSSVNTADQISIHALLAESDGCLFCEKLQLLLIFLSTLSLRRATVNGGAPSSSSGNFYPRSPCGERHSKCPRLAWQFTISIHALLAESDPHCSAIA